MKTVYRLLPVLLFIFILAPGMAKAHDDYTKVIKKEYAVNPNAQLVLDNKFGQIHCNNWDKNVVSVEVRITVTASSQEKATKLLDLVNIAWEGSPTNVSVKTNFDKEGFSGNSKVSVDY